MRNRYWIPRLSRSEAGVGHTCKDVQRGDATGNGRMLIIGQHPLKDKVLDPQSQILCSVLHSHSNSESKSDSRLRCPQVAAAKEAS